MEIEKEFILLSSRVQKKKNSKMIVCGRKRKD